MGLAARKFGRRWGERSAAQSAGLKREKRK
jgi:hypothetical protein